MDGSSFYSLAGKVVQNRDTNGNSVGIDFIAQKGVSILLCHWGRIRWPGASDARVEGLVHIESCIGKSILKTDGYIAWILVFMGNILVLFVLLLIFVSSKTPQLAEVE